MSVPFISQIPPTPGSTQSNPFPQINPLKGLFCPRHGQPLWPIFPPPPLPLVTRPRGGRRRAGPPTRPPFPGTRGPPPVPRPAVFRGFLPQKAAWRGKVCRPPGFFPKTRRIFFGGPMPESPPVLCPGRRRRIPKAPSKNRAVFTSPPLRIPKTPRQTVPVVGVFKTLVPGGRPPHAAPPRRVEPTFPLPSPGRTQNEAGRSRGAPDRAPMNRPAPPI